MEAKQLTESIAAGLNFLHHRQRPSGHFVADRSTCADGPIGLEYDISTFVTASAVYCLRWIEGGQAQDIRQRAINALSAETRLRGLYRYFAEEQTFTLPQKRRAMPFTIVPDLDTTACTSFALAYYGRRVNNCAALLSYRNADGLLPSWVHQPADDLDDSLPFLIMVPIGDGLCCGVSANILMYLGDCPETHTVSAYIQASWQGGIPTNHASWYEEIGLAYVCSRAFFEGAHSLKPIRNIVLDCLHRRQRPDGSLGTAMETAAGACALMNFGVAGTELEAAVRFLVASQHTNGSWSRGTFFIGDQRTYAVEMRFAGIRRIVQPPAVSDQPVLCYFGSKDVTTLICMEALSRFLEAW